MYRDSKALVCLVECEFNGGGEVRGHTITERASVESMGLCLLLVGKGTLSLWHMTGDTGLFGVTLLDLEITDGKAIAALFVCVASHAALTIIVIFVAVVDIMIGRARSFLEESKEAALLLEDHFLSFFLSVRGEKIPLFGGIDIFIGFSVLFYALYLMAGLTGDGLSLLDGIVGEFRFA